MHPKTIDSDAAGHTGKAGHAQAKPETLQHSRLPVVAQGTLLAVFAGLLVVGLFVLPAIVSLAAPVEAPADAPAPDGAFKPTDTQWRGLQVKPVATRMFPPVSVTDGKIALDDDLTTQVFSPYSGRVTKVFAHAGDVVAAGTRLFLVDASEMSQAENDLVTAAATLHTAGAQLDLARAAEQRLHALYLGHGAALKDWQQSRVDLATAQGGLASAQIALAAVRNRLRIFGLPDEQIRVLETTRNLLRETASVTVRAPIAGTIIQRQIGPGQNIVGSTASAGAAQAVFSIGDLTKLWLVANARESDAGSIHIGDPVQVSVLAFPGQVFTATVRYVGASIDPNTHRLPVRAELDNSDGKLKPEMFADFEITTGQAAPSVGVPEDAVVFDGSDAHVWVADPAKKTLALRAITIGRTSQGMIEVTKGLAPGESVVTSGSVFIDRTVGGS
jgi:cobalt-zinc-cadmium efflux system membrane fusion protein